MQLFPTEFWVRPEQILLSGTWYGADSYEIQFPCRTLVVPLHLNIFIKCCAPPYQQTTLPASLVEGKGLLMIHFNPELATPSSIEAQAAVDDQL